MPDFDERRLKIALWGVVALVVGMGGMMAIVAFALRNY
jgi:hypothetical protein